MTPPLPASWVEGSLADLAVEAQSGFPSGRHNAEGIGIPHLRPMNVDRLGNIDLTEVKYVEAARDLRIVAGDVLFNNTNSPPLIGKTAYFDRAGEWAFSNHMTRLRPAVGLEPKFLAIQLHFLWSRGLFQELCSHHVNQASVSTRKLLEAVRVVVPPTEEQRRIVAAIEEQFSRLDAAHASINRARRNVKRMARAVLWSAFDTVWPRRPLVKLTDPARPICYGILKPKTSGDLTVPYVEVRSIRGGQVDLTSLRRTTEELHNEFRRSELHSGDVVLAIRGSFDRAAVVPAELEGANVSRDVARIAPTEVLNSRFLAYYLGGPHAYSYFARVARGVAVRGVNIGDLRTMPVPVPPPEEQQRVVAEVDQQLSILEAIDDEIERASRRAAALRRALLEQAFSGELVPQDPSDEPAFVLLERIAAERAAAPKPARRKRKIPA
jgi:type I restriction enzyme, S subunit